MAETIPNEIMLDIFSRLDIKTLFRVKFACSKAWQRMMDDNPCFANKHVARTAKSLLISDQNWTSSHTLEQHGDTFKTRSVAEVVIVDDVTSSTSLTLCGSCNGLVCFYSEQNPNLFVCNPLLKQVITIPRGRTDALSESYELGFDSKSNTYKIVHLIGDRDSTDVEIYTLGTNSWRRICEKFPYDCIFFSSFYALGALHWTFPIRSIVVSFDFDKEEFFVPLIPKANFLRAVVGLDDDLLALVQYNDIFSLNMHADIWKWKENCDDGTKKWSKDYGFNLEEQGVYDFRVMGALEDGEIVLETAKGLFTYNAEKNLLRRIYINGVTGDTKLIFIRGSLVSPYKLMH